MMKRSEKEIDYTSILNKLKCFIKCFTDSFKFNQRFFDQLANKSSKKTCGNAEWKGIIIYHICFCHLALTWNSIKIRLTLSKEQIYYPYKLFWSFLDS